MYVPIVKHNILNKKCGTSLYLNSKQNWQIIRIMWSFEKPAVQ